MSILPQTTPASSQPPANQVRQKLTKQLQLCAHCMGLLRDSGQVANKLISCLRQRPGDTALGQFLGRMGDKACCHL
jgi:hypothetical protein